MVFPLIRGGGGVLLAQRIAAMRADRDDHDCNLSATRRLTCDLTLTTGACAPWATLYKGLNAFMADLTEHIRLENDILLPQLKTKALAKVL